MTTISILLVGALAMASFVAGAFFLRYWRSSRDRLFLFFAVAFWTLAIDWTALALTEPGTNARQYVFVVRLVAFALIIVGIVDKNRRR
jgi:hypothetical protein